MGFRRAGGHIPNPTYAQVCDGDTGHAEVVQVVFDPEALSFRDLLEIFFAIHDPTTLNRQGNDVGPQYRSVIVFQTPQQEQEALSLIAELEARHVRKAPVVTELLPAAPFYPAEDYHQGYFRKNPGQGYCAVVVAPKVAKLRQAFRQRLKPEFR